MWFARVAVAAGLGPAWAKRAYQDEVNLRLLLAFTLSQNSNCIDVGSYEGRFLSDIVRVAPHGQHIAYEPLPHLASVLTRTFPGVEVRKAALSDVDGQSEFIFARNLPSYSGLRRRAYPSAADIEVLSVRTERLDDHLPPGYVPSLIKVDVEGAEQLVFEGAMETLRRHRPVVVFEHGKGASDYYGASPRDVFNLLANMAGLRIFDLDGNGPYSLPQFEETYDRSDRWNFVAHR
jgi:FkbM family methyltransferase